MTDRIEQIIHAALLQSCDNHKDRAELARETARQVMEVAPAVEKPPAGWKLVPADDLQRPFCDPAIPDEMVFAGSDALDKAYEDLRRGVGPDWDTGMICVAVYRAMLAAAPEAPEEPPCESRAERLMHAMEGELDGHTCDVEAAMRILAYVDASADGAQTAPVQAVKVKPLEWTPFRAETPWGYYNIDDQTDRSAAELSGRAPFLLSGSRVDNSRFNSLEAARAAAQSDYEHRILSTLVAAPSYADGLKEGLRRAAALVREKHIVHGAGMYLLVPRWGGNISGLAYADAIEALSLLTKEEGR